MSSVVSELSSSSQMSLPLLDLSNHRNVLFQLQTHLHSYLAFAPLLLRELLCYYARIRLLPLPLGPCSHLCPALKAFLHNERSPDPTHIPLSTCYHRQHRQDAETPVTI
ncbi:MAG: hypothetical protein FJ390_07595 [Verrucomicrobia bacterium]|nr:hypothetical protein [Verrucomicrobiota bacterium]